MGYFALNRIISRFLYPELYPVFSGEFSEISKNTFPYRTPPVAASVLSKTQERQEAYKAPYKVL